jgi:hypothetical protein
MEQCQTTTAADRKSIQDVGLPLNEFADGLLRHAEQFCSSALIAITLFESANEKMIPGLVQESCQIESGARLGQTGKGSMTGWVSMSRSAGPSTSCGENSAERSNTFNNSRTFPGQVCCSKRRRASLENWRSRLRR